MIFNVLIAIESTQCCKICTNSFNSLCGLFLSSTVPKDTPVTQMKNFLEATTLSDNSLHSEETLDSPSAVTNTLEPPVQLWKDIDQAEAKDPLFSAEYAPNIYAYMRKREVCMYIHVSV